MKKPAQQFVVLSVLISVLIAAFLLGGVAFVNQLIPSSYNYSNGTSVSLVFTVNYTGPIGLMTKALTLGRVNCTLMIDSVKSGTNYSRVANKNVSFHANHSIANGTHYWNVTCTNSSGNKQSTNTSKLVIDRFAPSVGLLSPKNGVNITNTSIVLYWNVTDRGSDTRMNCSLRVLSRVNRTLPRTSSGLGVSNSTTWLNGNNTLTFSATHNKRFKWNVTCFDNATNTKTSVTRTFSIDRVKPGVTKNSTNNFTRWKEDTKQNMIFNVSDSLTNISSCRLYMDGVNQGTMTLHATRGFANKSLNFSNPTNHTFIANCTDVVGNYNDTSSYLVEINDTQTPAIQSISLAVTTTTLTWTIRTDDRTNITVNYGTNNWSVQSLGNQSSDSAKAYNHTFAITGLTADKLYYYNVTLRDRGGRNVTNSSSSGTLRLASSSSTGGGGGGGGTTTTTAVTTVTEAVITGITPVTAADITSGVASSGGAGGSGGREAAGAGQAGVVAPSAAKQAAAAGAAPAAKMSFFSWVKSLFARLFSIFT